MDKKTILSNLFDDILAAIYQTVEVGSETVHTSIVSHTFTNLVCFHKLEGRVECEYFLDKKLNPLLASNIRNKLIKTNQEAQLQHRKQCTIIKQISKYFLDSKIAELPVVIKGVSTYFTTKDRSNLRFSSDIDLIYSDPVVLEKLLNEMGFMRVSDDSVSDHEYCHMVKDGVVIDIHKYIPIINYSSGMVSKALKASASNVKIIFESFTKIVTETIEYSEIRSESSPCDDLDGILLPNASIQILISCAHTFRNYINSLFHFSSGVKLADLLDIIDLMQLSSFNPYHLSKVITTDGRYNSISFVGYLLRTIFSFSHLSDIFSPNLVLYPKHLFWDGTMYMPTHKYEYIYYPLHQFTKNIDSTIIRPLIDDQTIEITKQYNSHGIVHIDLASIKKTADKLTIKLQVENVPAFRISDSFEIICNDVEFSFSYSSNTLTHEVRKPNYQVRIIEDLPESIYIAEIGVPIDELLIAPWISIGIVIKVTRWGNGPISTMIPVYIDLSEITLNIESNMP